MSLNLECLEAKLNEYVGQTRLHKAPALFHYSADLTLIYREVQKVLFKLERGQYGPKTTAKANSLIAQWENVGSHLIPNMRLPHSEIILWTLRTYGFYIHTQDLAQFNSKTYTLRQVEVGSRFLVFYLNEHELKVDMRSDEKWRVPLRTFLACIYPAIYGGNSAGLNNVPPDILVQVLQFLPLESLGAVTALNRGWKTVCDSDLVWKYIYERSAEYTNCQPTEVESQQNPFKGKVKDLVEIHDRHRMARFARSVDWATPWFSDNLDVDEVEVLF